MSTASPPQIPQRTAAALNGWTRYRDGVISEGEAVLGQLRLKIFMVVVGIATATLLLLSLRSLQDSFARALPDLANAGVFALILVGVALRPKSLRWLSWAGLVALFVNVVEGLSGVGPVVKPTHVLLPTLVLFGALIGDRRISVAALLGVLAILLWTVASAWPLEGWEGLVLGNLAIASVASFLAALSVWSQHHAYERMLQRQAEHLRSELDARLRLNAVIFHDLNNPLTALMGASELAIARPAETGRYLQIVKEMSDRMRDIIESARRLGTVEKSPVREVRVEDLATRVQEVFERRLEEKQQVMELVSGGELRVSTNPEILVNSVLGNLVSNAMKFSPRGSRIELSAGREDHAVRIEVSDEGPGLPAELVQKGVVSGSKPGSEGEKGSGFGLRISALCLERLQGRLEVRDRAGSGATVSVVLPAARGE